MITPFVHPFKLWRKRGVPIAIIETADPRSAIIACQRSLNGGMDEIAFVSWDCVRGLSGLNTKGIEALPVMCPNEMPPETLTNPVECLSLAAAKAPQNTVLFMHGMGAVIDQFPVRQAIWNCRDVFKDPDRKCTLILLGDAIKIPGSLKHDVMSYTEALPDKAELEKIVSDTLSNASMTDKVKPEAKALAVDRLRGLSAFAAEQVLAVSLVPAGIDQDRLWDRKRRMIEQTPGLECWQGGETFNDLGGLENLKGFLRSVLTSGKSPVRAILYLDEIEKSMGGAGGDTSGTSQDQLGVILRVMQDWNLRGIILVGPPGTGKSSIAKAAGNVASAPVIACDLGAMKDSLVGASEARIRAAMDVFRAVSQGDDGQCLGLVICTCNKLASLPPELKRRFSLGTFYIDIPSAEELPAIWALWINRYKLDAQKLPDATDWTGAEIRACCDVAFCTGMSLIDAAKFVVPVIKSAPEQIAQLRQLASGKFISASYPGPYQASRNQPKTSTEKTVRNIEV